MRLIYKILILLVIALLGIWGVYFVWQKITSIPEEDVKTGFPNAVVPPAGTRDLTDGGTEEATPGVGISKVSDGAAFGFVTSPDTLETKYITADGMIFRAKEGADEEISGQRIGALRSVLIDSGRERALVSFGSSKAPQWGIFDFIDGVWRPLAGEIKEAAWGRDGNEIYGFKEENGKGDLVRIDLIKTPPSYKTILGHFDLLETKISWAEPGALFFSERPSAKVQGKVWRLDLKDLSLRLVFSPRDGLTTGWSEDGKILFTFSPPDEFAILDSSLRGIAPVFFATLPRKCAVSSELKAVYCFVPKPPAREVVLPDDYLMKRYYSADDLFEVDLRDGAIKKIFASGSGGLPALDGISPSYAGGHLYFINRYDDGVYKVKIAK